MVGSTLSVTTTTSSVNSGSSSGSISFPEGDIQPTSLIDSLTNSVAANLHSAGKSQQKLKNISWTYNGLRAYGEKINDGEIPQSVDLMGRIYHFFPRSGTDTDTVKFVNGQVVDLEAITNEIAATYFPTADFPEDRIERVKAIWDRFIAEIKPGSGKEQAKDRLHVVTAAKVIFLQWKFEQLRKSGAVENADAIESHLTDVLYEQTTEHETLSPKNTAVRLLLPNYTVQERQAKIAAMYDKKEVPEIERTANAIAAYCKNPSLYKIEVVVDKEKGIKSLQEREIKFFSWDFFFSLFGFEATNWKEVSEFLGREAVSEPVIKKLIELANVEKSAEDDAFQFDANQVGGVRRGIIATYQAHKQTQGLTESQIAATQRQIEQQGALLQKDIEDSKRRKRVQERKGLADITILHVFTKHLPYASTIASKMGAVIVQNTGMLSTTDAFIVPKKLTPSLVSDFDPVFLYLSYKRDSEQDDVRVVEAEDFRIHAITIDPNSLQTVPALKPIKIVEIDPSLDNSHSLRDEGGSSTGSSRPVSTGFLPNDEMDPWKD